MNSSFPVVSVPSESGGNSCLSFSKVRSTIRLGALPLFQMDDFVDVVGKNRKWI